MARIIALFLIPVLLAEPVLAGMRPQARVNLSACSLFSNQALADRPTMIPRRFVLKGLIVLAASASLPAQQTQTITRQIQADRQTLLATPRIEETGRSLGSKRLLAVAGAYPGQRAAIRAIEALQYAVANEKPQAAFFEARLWDGAVDADRAALNSILTVIRDPNDWLTGIKAAFYVYPTDTALRKEFMEKLLTQRVLAAKSRSELYQQEYLQRLLRAMADRYQRELDDLAHDASKDHSLRESASGFLFNKRPAEYPTTPSHPSSIRAGNFSA